MELNIEDKFVQSQGEQLMFRLSCMLHLKKQARQISSTFVWHFFANKEMVSFSSMDVLQIQDQFFLNYSRFLQGYCKGLRFKYDGKKRIDIL